jgi:hypothetical protein
MDSVIRNACSHALGFPIRKSPDHSLLAASRGLSQLTTSFIAFLRQGIHTHALSSLTIKSTSYTTHSPVSSVSKSPRQVALLSRAYTNNLCFLMPVNHSVVKDLDCLSNRQNLFCELLNTCLLLFSLLSLVFGGPGWN